MPFLIAASKNAAKTRFGANIDCVLVLFSLQRVTPNFLSKDFLIITWGVRYVLFVEAGVCGRAEGRFATGDIVGQFMFSDEPMLNPGWSLVAPVQFAYNAVPVHILSGSHRFTSNDQYITKT